MLYTQFLSLSCHKVGHINKSESKLSRESIHAGTEISSWLSALIQTYSLSHAPMDAYALPPHIRRVE